MPIQNATTPNHHVSPLVFAGKMAFFLALLLTFLQVVIRQSVQAPCQASGMNRRDIPHTLITWAHLPYFLHLAHLCVTDRSSCLPPYVGLQLVYPSSCLTFSRYTHSHDVGRFARGFVAVLGGALHPPDLILRSAATYPAVTYCRMYNRRAPVDNARRRVHPGFWKYPAVFCFSFQGTEILPPPPER